MFTHGNAVGGGGSTQGWPATLSAFRPAQASRPTANCYRRCLSPGPAARSRPLHLPQAAPRDRPLEQATRRPLVIRRLRLPPRPTMTHTSEPGSGIHQLDLRLPAPVDQRPYFEHHLRRIAGALPPRRWQQRPRLLGKPARSEVPVPGNNSELGWYIACAANSLTCPSGFTTGQQLSVALRPFPFPGVTDQFGSVSNSNYNALQATLNMRASHGLTFMASYTWSRSIDDGGTFRSGYDIPAAFSGDGKFHKADSIERSVSTSNQPHHVVVTGVWDLPFGRTLLEQRLAASILRWIQALHDLPGLHRFASGHHVLKVRNQSRT